MKTLNRIETGRDARGNKYQTKTYQDFAEITPTTGVTSFTLTQEDGVYTLVETITESVPDPGGGGGGTTYPDIWSVDISTVTEPIETFLLFQPPYISTTEMANWTAWKQGRETATDPSKSANQYVQQLLLRYNRGQVDYLTPRIILRHQKVYQNPPTFAGVGYAQNTVTGNPFNFNSNVNFLFTGATAVQEGTLYRVSLEWLTSKQGKWDSYIYGP
jgi:hypothetical protein